MKTTEERLQWKHDAQHIERHVDQMVEVLRDDANAVPVAYMAIDMVYRPYLQWLHSAQLQKCDATATRNSAIHLVNMMIIEMLSRMVNREQGIDGAIEWADEFMGKLNEELDEDLRLLMRRLHAENDNTRTE